MDGARIYAQGAIREKGQAINYLRLSARIDAVASRVQTAVDMSGVTKSMCGVVKGMDKVLSGMNVEKISKAMDKFEKQVRSITSFFLLSSPHTVTSSIPLYRSHRLTLRSPHIHTHTHSLTHTHTRRALPQKFEDLDVRSAYMNEAMSSTTASATPEDEVDNLIRMVADEHSLDVGVGMDELGAPATGVPQAAQAAAPEGKEDDLAARLAALHKG